MKLSLRGCIILIIIIMIMISFFESQSYQTEIQPFTYRQDQKCEIKCWFLVPERGEPEYQMKTSQSQSGSLHSRGNLTPVKLCVQRRLEYGKKGMISPLQHQPCSHIISQPAIRNEINALLSFNIVLLM